MKVRTSAVINQPPDKVWPMLCNSKMDEHIPLQFKFGIPKPVQCRLKSGVGGVGRERQCISNIGVVNQMITRWDENKRLEFEMEDTDMYFGKFVSSIKERFDLTEAAGGGTRVTRTTEFKIKGWLGLPKSLFVWVGLKNVHRYVFANWVRTGDAQELIRPIRANR
jgi:hypothetical protein